MTYILPFSVLYYLQYLVQKLYAKMRGHKISLLEIDHFFEFANLLFTCWWLYYFIFDYTNYPKEFTEPEDNRHLHFFPRAW